MIYLYQKVIEIKSELEKIRETNTKYRVVTRVTGGVSDEINKYRFWKYCFC